MKNLETSSKEKFIKILINKYFLGFVFLLIILMLIDWFIFGRTPADEFNQMKTSISSKTESQGQKNSLILNQSESSDTNSTQENENQEKQNAQTQLSLNPLTATKDEFNRWIQAESNSMNNYNFNEVQEIQKYTKLAQQLSSEQFKTLIDKATDSQVPIQERSLAAYLMSLVGHDKVSVLVDFLQKDLSLKNPAEPHSVDETQNVQERALRILAINRLYELGKNGDPQQVEIAKNELKKIIPNLADLTLRNYAESKLKEISR